MREEEIRNRLKDKILAKLTEDELAGILAEHKKLSQALGFSVGIHAKGDQTIEKKVTYIDGQDAMLQVKSVNKDIIFSFLRVSIDLYLKTL